MYSDHHVHTAFSSDSKAPMEQMVRQAVALGLREIVFTDHVDFDYGGEEPTPPGMFLVDYPAYRAEVLRLREAYGSRIRINLGVELGLQGHLKERITRLVQENEYDFIIGSTHCIQNVDLYYPTFYRGKPKAEAYAAYFEDLLNNVKTFDEFCVYGHMDYVDRYAPYADKSLEYRDYADLIDEILRVLVQKGKGLEINTSGYKYGLHRAHPQLAILRRFRELGGEIVTLGSDAHDPGRITDHFTDALALLSAAGFRYTAVFHGQKPEFISLERFKK